MANQCYLTATNCSGTGPATVYLLQAVAKRLAAATFYFQNAGSCYSVDPRSAVANPPPSSAGPFAAPIGRIFTSCAACRAACSVTPTSAYFDCSSTGSQPVTVVGAAGATIYLGTSSNWIVLNGLGPNPGGVSTTITLGASGTGTFTVATSGALTGGTVPCPASDASVEVGTSSGGGECGTVAVSTLTGCPDLSVEFPTVSVGVQAGGGDCTLESGTFTLPSDGGSSWLGGSMLLFCRLSNGAFFWSYGYLDSETGGNVPFTGSPVGLTLPVYYVGVNPPTYCGIWRT